MKTLYIVRHAKSSWKNPDLADFDRPLNKRGKKDAEAMGKRMKNQLILPDLIICSPAKRARKTAKMIAKQLGYAGKKIIKYDIIYHGLMPDLLDLIRAVDDSHKKLMLIGHNPDLTSLANMLTDQFVSNIPTCGIFCAEIDVDSWKNVAPRIARFISFDYPRKYDS
jgi:phosphohistidine phosphatase